MVFRRQCIRSVRLGRVSQRNGGVRKGGREEEHEQRLRGRKGLCGSEELPQSGRKADVTGAKRVCRKAQQGPGQEVHLEGFMCSVKEHTRYL